MIAAKRAAHRQFYNLMRLCDYVAFSALHNLVIESVESMLKRFVPKVSSPSYRGKVPLFSCSLHMAEDSTLTHMPNDVEFTAEIDGIVGSFVSTASSGIRLLGHPDVKDLTDLYEGEPIAEQNLVALIIEGDQRYLDLTSQITVASRREFRTCNDALYDFQHLAQITVSNSSFDIEVLEAYAEKHRSDFSELVKMLYQFRDQMAAVDAIADFRDYGIIRVQLNVFKGQVSPSPKSCHDQVSLLMPRLLTRRCNSVHEQMAFFTAGLSRSPKSVEDFVAFVLFIEEVRFTTCLPIDSYEVIHHVSSSAHVRWG